MKNHIKKILILAIAMVVLAFAVTCPVSAESTNNSHPQTLLALGDSLTTGYGLDNYEYGGSPYLCDSYANMIAKAMGLEGGKTYINRAVNGDTSADLAKLIPSLENEVKAAEMIIITIGGNDLLGLIPTIASQIAGRTVTDFAEAAAVLMSVNADGYAALANDPGFKAMIAATLASLGTNLHTIASFIKENAPNARVLFLKQYNPMKNVPGFSAFGDFGGMVLDSINSIIETTGQVYGYEIMDVPSVIDSDAVGLTNILAYDIHPNAKGHTEIAKLLAKYLGLSLGLSDESEETKVSEETTKVPEETTNFPEETTHMSEVTTGTPEAVTNTPKETAQTPVETVTAPIGTDIPEPMVQNGCASVISCATLLLASVCAAFIMKKNNR